MAQAQNYVLMKDDVQLADLVTNGDSVSNIIESEPEGPKGGMGLKRACCASPHMKSWIFSLLFWTSIVMKLVCFFWRDELCCCDATSCDNSELNGSIYNYDFQEFINDWQTICTESVFESYANDINNVCSEPCNFAMSWYGLGVLAAVYLFYWIETCCSSSRRYLSNTGLKETVYEYVNRIKSYPPSIYWWVECYHYETRTRTYTDSNGNTQTETYQEKVVTWSNNMYYHFNSWCDKSGQLIGLEHYKLTKITYHKTYVFANQETRNNYNYEWNRFLRENNRDTYQSSGETFKIRDYTKKMLSEVEKGAKPCCLNLCSFLLWSMIGLTSCYRSWFGAIVGSRKKFTFVKEINSQ